MLLSSNKGAMIPVLVKLKKRVIFVLGGPGSGKDTVCNYLSKVYNMGHLSAGQLLRKEIADPTSKLGELIEKHIVSGMIVPAVITCRILRKEMESQTTVNTFIINGFPRNKENMDGWYREMGRRMELLFVLYLQVSEDVMVKRCISRNDSRTDDNLETITKRLKIFYEETMPVIVHFLSHNMVRILDGNKAENDVYKSARAIFDQCR